MTYGNIKIETLRLMGLPAQDLITEEYLETYEKDETYKSYLSMLHGALMRCFALIEERRVLPTRSFTLSAADGISGKAFIRFDLKRLCESYFDLERVVCETERGEYIADCHFKREGDVLVLPLYKDTDGIAYTAVYRPCIKRFPSYANNDTELDLPEYIAAFIPYYLKGELYRTDEPNEAAEARNQFEQLISEIRERSVTRVTGVATVYSQTED